MQERRKHQRFQVALPLQVFCDAEAAVIQTFTHDVSEGGLAFMVDTPLPQGAAVTCMMDLSSRRQAGYVSFRGTVVRVEQTADRHPVKVAVAADYYRFTV